jgi:hypothetical protein
MRRRIAVRASGAPAPRCPVRRSPLRNERNTPRHPATRNAARSARDFSRRARPDAAIVADFVPAVVH